MDWINYHHLAELATHRLEMVLADHPYNAPSTIRIFDHRLGMCGVTFFAAAMLEVFGGPS